MITIETITTAKDLKDGDIFYYTPNPVFNDWLGDDFHLTGHDMILIADDVSSLISDESILVNGGFDLCIHKNDEVLILGHYSTFKK